MRRFPKSNERAENHKYMRLLPSLAEFLSDGCNGLAVQHLRRTWKDDLLFHLDVLFVQMLEPFGGRQKPLFVLVAQPA